MNKDEVMIELAAIITYCEAVRRDNNRGRMKLLVRDDIQSRAQKLLDHFAKDTLNDG